MYANEGYKGAWSKKGGLKGGGWGILCKLGVEEGVAFRIKGLGGMGGVMQMKVKMGGA